jgi:hypothetical protein
VQAIEEQNIPLAKCIYDGQEYFMKAHIVNDLNFPNSPDNNVPQMIVEKGKTLTIEFDGDKPIKLNALVVDYDADILERSYHINIFYTKNELRNLSYRLLNENREHGLLRCSDSFGQAQFG